MEHHLHIKNMVCPRCIATVTEVLTRQGLTVREVKLGEALVTGDVHEPAVAEALWEQGFELLQEKDEQLTDLIKTTLLEYQRHLEENYQPLTTSVYLAEKLGLSYQHLSKVFSQQTGTTIEKYLIRLKIERVKELISYGELTLSEIAHRLQYSSVQHLSNQFKKVTGTSVTDYKKAPTAERLSLDKLV
ncbi:helix-turn-helix domain-containing protein [Rufibacter immobilis]|uniref:Helix-turn-helix domain-containing protein n=1 Tax=Rufibacter immobilis TaxID=1348778 RepID=A0A3M9N7Z5_9BACT|nr:helix-turn-helix domain-containing protein [Rufibacter immobilis]RNI33128.1 helix-turn-helix domain-containing protein [Rufibacter immobilis]